MDIDNDDPIELRKLIKCDQDESHFEHVKNVDCRKRQKDKYNKHPGNTDNSKNNVSADNCNQKAKIKLATSSRLKQKQAESKIKSHNLENKINALIELHSGSSQIELEKFVTHSIFLETEVSGNRTQLLSTDPNNSSLAPVTHEDLHHYLKLLQIRKTQAEKRRSQRFHLQVNGQQAKLKAKDRLNKKNLRSRQRIAEGKLIANGMDEKIRALEEISFDCNFDLRNVDIRSLLGEDFLQDSDNEETTSNDAISSVSTDRVTMNDVHLFLRLLHTRRVDAMQKRSRRSDPIISITERKRDLERQQRKRAVLKKHSTWKGLNRTQMVESMMEILYCPVPDEIMLNDEHKVKQCN